MRIAAAILFVLWALGLSTGCQPVAGDAGMPQETTVTATAEPVMSTGQSTRISIPLTELPERIMPTETASHRTDEVPEELLNKIIADLAERTGIPSDRILVIQSQATIWNDGSLGCPQPGVFYTQALVNGFWVILEAEGQKYDYRASESGYFFICKNGTAPLAPRGTPGS